MNKELREAHELSFRLRNTELSILKATRRIRSLELRLRKFREKIDTINEEIGDFLESHR